MSDSKSTSAKTPDWKSEPFRIIEVCKTEAPDGDGKGPWYRYVISQGNEPLIGLRKGSKKSVTAAANEVVTCLNLRRLGKMGRVHLSTRKSGS